MMSGARACLVLGALTIASALHYVYVGTARGADTAS